MLPTKWRFIWPSGFRGEDFQKLTNQKQELPVAAIFINGSGRNEQFYRGPLIDASYQVSVHLAKWFQRRRFFRNQPIRNKNCLWRPCLLMNQDKMSKSNLYREHSIDASYQVSVHLAKRFQRRIYFQKLNNYKQELPVAAIFVNGSGRNEQSLQRTFHRCFLPSLYHLAKRFQRKSCFRNGPIRNKNCL